MVTTTHDQLRELSTTVSIQADCTNAMNRQMANSALHRMPTAI